ncbi:hypothetical protein A256_20960 [Pseudomonas syringae pv. actinidiae ICMP 19103]|nr:hypothetical protein IYO_027865 [Pseudomonas syringae pv. actinidiae ICMP 18884]AOE59558.1 hypothetical protein NZ708_27735 [Pseudomonas syringae pv. actinidiae ICMP 18708]APQ00510.1 hypothetical protein PsaNZ45_28295 [Pseudomonas syringae pv. actinidiae]AYL83846.1 hypothetical protein CN228_31635 [Pseudomonas syringae pv. actinidiae str. Shaanxi_M228]EPM48896.1 hypothetical protein A256_20960 [Pseudomonas syringae pv. actinidiae ICMP 19103]EPM84640.1 hypothetical protein A260_21231 [Pseudo
MGVARGWAGSIVRDSDWMNLCRRQTIIVPTPECGTIVARKNTIVPMLRGHAVLDAPRLLLIMRRGADL